MKPNRKLWRSAVVVIGLLVVAAASAGADHRVVEPGQKFSGKSYNELAGEWTNWLVAEPVATNPAFDPDGRFCDRNQQGSVWFLASTFGGVVDRTCEVPAGKAIFLSLGGVFASFSPEFPAADDPCSQMATDLEKVRCDVNNDVPVAPGISFEVTLDGEPVEDLLAFRAQSQPGGYTLRVPDPSLLTDLGHPRRSLPGGGGWILSVPETAEPGRAHPQPARDPSRPVREGCQLYPDHSGR